MKKFIAIAFVFAMVVSVASMASAGVTSTGNGAPSGAHYNLNIIGVSKDKSVDFSGDGGHRIFVPLDRKTAIKLYEGDFAVLDANGTDGKASFQLPNPDPNNTGISSYSVWARPLGTPGGKANMSTCATSAGLDGIFGTADDEELCSVSVMQIERTKGKQLFADASQYLLYVYVDLDGDGISERYNIFNDALQDYFWQYDNNGLKVLQLRFYPGVSSVVPASI